MASNPEFAHLDWVKPEDVAKALQSKDETKRVVLDVRKPEEVAKDGHISGAVNFCSTQMGDVEQLDKLIDESVAGNQEVFVHCLFCQQRGPKAADRLLKRLLERGVAGPQVKVIDGGFAAFANQFKEEKELVDLPEGWVPPVQH